ncbi:hypothetical protein M758_8G039800 [Ceratodon purpureus]|nr:hypothetical protein M758_8G039800 [Ceratodon purpureus]
MIINIMWETPERSVSRKTCSLSMSSCKRVPLGLLKATGKLSYQSGYVSQNSKLAVIAQSSRRPAATFNLRCSSMASFSSCETPQAKRYLNVAISHQLKIFHGIIFQIIVITSTGHRQCCKAQTNKPSNIQLIISNKRRTRHSKTMTGSRKLT